MASERKLRPDVYFTIDKTRKHRDEDYDLIENDDGFHCHDCGWRSLSLPLESMNDAGFDACPECGSKGVENKLTTHIEEVRTIFEEANLFKDEFVPYSHFAEEFEPPQDRLNEALNHLLTRDRAYVVFDKGETYIHITGE